MKNLIKVFLPVLALCAVEACSHRDELQPVNPNEGKELIQFAGKETLATKNGFAGETTVQMHIKAVATGKTTRYTETFMTGTDNDLSGGVSELSYESGKERYWDDAFGRDSKLTVYALAVPGNKDKSVLPVWSKNGWTAVDSKTNRNWFTDSNEEDDVVSWSVLAEQGSNDILKKEDLTFSNNISEGGRTGNLDWRINQTDGEWVVCLDDGPLEWSPKTNAPGETTGKFSMGWLQFKHALAKIEINIKEGEGFRNSANTDFIWTNTTTGQNIRMIGFNTAGSFHISTGAWSDQTSGDITKLYETTGTPANKTTRHLQAYVVPGTDLSAATGNVLEFEIDNAKYYVTGTQITEAIRNYDYGNDYGGKKYHGFTAIEGGKHYVINLTVAKKKIESVKAAVLDWETINSDDVDARNTYVTFDMEDRGSQLTDTDAASFNIYRSTVTSTNFIDMNSEADYNWSAGYEGPATKSWDSTTGWSTDWYWENNLTSYHFRAAGSKEGAGVTLATETGTPDVDYFAIKSGTLAESDYKDYVWGAPFKQLASSSDKLTYSTTSGFDNENNNKHQITNAIAATESTIGMMLFHMTSQVFVTVKTTLGADKVVLKEDDKETKVEILNFLPDGRVRMGNGLVETTGTTRTSAAMATGTYKAETATEGAQVENYSYGIVPQPLTYTDGTVGLRITTPDGNQYVVKDLSQCKASVNNANLTNPYPVAGTQYQINQWYPHYQYSYTVTIKKTQIWNMIAEALPWATVNCDLGTIDLEN